jgi:hypothetical protein
MRGPLMLGLTILGTEGGDEGLGNGGCSLRSKV